MQTFDTPGSVSLQIKLPSGRVVVTTVDEPKTTVEVVALGRRGRDPAEDIEITMDEHAGRHVLRVEQKVPPPDAGHHGGRVDAERRDEPWNGRHLRARPQLADVDAREQNPQQDHADGKLERHERAAPSGMRWIPWILWVL